ncbi:hypothetical protein JOB18_001103 [Solea senegalensis]|uniref:Uncharacterized protein n=1 Tax=Solea senegalensis TaxID=28829 RepID=A0AAV6QCL9_SOLSE|nr:hypothetical protein JOB18_001103 [Solea senegalensis]
MFIFTFHSANALDNKRSRSEVVFGERAITLRTPSQHEDIMGFIRSNMMHDAAARKTYCRAVQRRKRDVTHGQKPQQYIVKWQGHIKPDLVFVLVSSLSISPVIPRPCCVSVFGPHGCMVLMHVRIEKKYRELRNRLERITGRDAEQRSRDKDEKRQSNRTMSYDLSRQQINNDQNGSDAARAVIPIIVCPGGETVAISAAVKPLDSIIAASIIVFQQRFHRDDHGNEFA